jgi:hypothetical protein
MKMPPLKEFTDAIKRIVPSTSVKKGIICLPESLEKTRLEFYFFTKTFTNEIGVDYDLEHLGEAVSDVAWSRLTPVERWTWMDVCSLVEMVDEQSVLDELTERVRRRMMRNPRMQAKVKAMGLDDQMIKEATRDAVLELFPTASDREQQLYLERQDHRYDEPRS